MTPLEVDEVPRLTIKAYLDAIPARDHGAYDFSRREIPYVYGTPDGRYAHVLVRASVPDVFLVIVLDAVQAEIVGHHLLDLPKRYGFDQVTFAAPE